jgi:hypothetical protein
MLPLAAALNMYLTGERPSRNITMSLAWITIGIAVTSVTDIHVNFAGSIFSLIAVVTTVLNQVNPTPFASSPDPITTPHLLMS